MKAPLAFDRRCISPELRFSSVTYWNMLLPRALYRPDAALIRRFSLRHRKWHSHVVANWRGDIVNKTLVVGFIVAALCGVPIPAQGQGWYVGSELGTGMVQALSITGFVQRSGQRLRRVHQSAVRDGDADGGV